MNSAYELHQDRRTGSLERGKLADLIVLDRNVLRIPKTQIMNTKVLLTMVGGKTVYAAKRFR
jgi:predicted amidohydrolase YtcJ